MTNQGIWRRLFCSLCQQSDIQQDTGRSIDVRDGYDFVFVGFELLNQLLDPDSVTNRGFYLPRNCSICFQAFGLKVLSPYLKIGESSGVPIRERIAKLSRVQD
jgi:hypothetical protein